MCVFDPVDTFVVAARRGGSSPPTATACCCTGCRRQRSRRRATRRLCMPSPGCSVLQVRGSAPVPLQQHRCWADARCRCCAHPGFQLGPTPPRPCRCSAGLFEPPPPDRLAVATTAGLVLNNFSTLLFLANYTAVLPPTEALCVRLSVPAAYTGCALQADGNAMRCSQYGSSNVSLSTVACLLQAHHGSLRPGRHLCIGRHLCLDAAFVPGAPALRCGCLLCR